MALSMRKVFLGLTKIYRKTYSTKTHLGRIQLYEQQHQYKSIVTKACFNGGPRYKQYYPRRLPMVASVTGFVSWLLDVDSTEESGEEKLILAMKKAVLAQRRGNYAEAEKLFHDALEIVTHRHKSEEITDSEARRIQAILFGYMSNLALESGDLKKAEMLYKDTMKWILSMGMGKDDNAIVEISLKLAAIYAMSNRLAEAEAGYKFCIDTQEGKVASEDCDENSLALLGMCVQGYARYLYMQRHLEDAKKQYEKSLDISERVLGPEHEQNLVILSDLAIICCELNDFTAAQETLEKVVKVATAIESSTLPTYLCNLGAILLQKGDLAKSKEVCDQAVVLARQNNDEEVVLKARFCLNEIKKRQGTN